MEKKTQVSITADSQRGSDIVREELDNLLRELHELLTRCTTRLQPILTKENDTDIPARDRHDVRSDLFEDIYFKIFDCREMVREYHLVIDRIDL